MKIIKKLYFKLNDKVLINDKPYFGSLDAIDFFEKNLSKSMIYLEWGAGGSTVCALRLQKKMYTIDSDKKYLKKIMQHVGNVSQSCNYKLIYRNIGPVGRWGYPIFYNKLFFDRYKKYSDLPDFDTFPDFILIDGRFRVACALKIAEYCHTNNIETVNLCVDDYIKRDHYNIIEKYFVLSNVYGSMAVFNSVRSISTNELICDIEKYELDPR